MDMFDSVGGRMVQVRVSPVAWKELALGDGRHRAFKLLFTGARTQWVSWVDDRGRVLVQGTPFGLSLWRANLPAAAEAELASDMGLSAGRAPTPSP